MNHLFLGIFFLCGIWTADAAINRNGEWSPWSVFATKCTKECGTGTQKRSRSCTNPEPSGTGNKCTKTDNTLGDFEERTENCNSEPCFEEKYTDWVECDNCTIGVKYKEPLCGNVVCDKDGSQYKRINETYCNKWNKATCPSPCEDVECPEYGKCRDISTETEPLYKCVCTMGYVMNEKKTTCIRPPPTTPTPRPIPTLPAAEKTVATVLSKGASIVLIVFVSITLALFLLLRIFTHDRVIQMNMEIALLLAHIFLMFPSNTSDNVILCKLVSIAIHLCFTACYLFMMLEAFHMYFLVAYVVKKDGAFTKMQNIVIGWGLAAFIVLCCMCFEYDNYGGEYHCWLRMDKSLVYGHFVPVIVIVIITFTLIEAAGATDYKPLDDFDEEQRLSAKISQRTNLIIIPFILAHWFIGMFAEYEQNLPLYGTFSVLNGITGFIVFFFHCTNNQLVREKLKSIFKKCTGKKEKKEPIVG